MSERAQEGRLGKLVNVGVATPNMAIPFSAHTPENFAFSPIMEVGLPSYCVADMYALFADLDGAQGLLATSFLLP